MKKWKKIAKKNRFLSSLSSLLTKMSSVSVPLYLSILTWTHHHHSLICCQAWPSATILLPDEPPGLIHLSPLPVLLMPWDPSAFSACPVHPTQPLRLCSNVPSWKTCLSLKWNQSCPPAPICGNILLPMPPPPPTNMPKIIPSVGCTRLCRPPEGPQNLFRSPMVSFPRPRDVV